MLTIMTWWVLASAGDTWFAGRDAFLTQTPTLGATAHLFDQRLLFGQPMVELAAVPESTIPVPRDHCGPIEQLDLASYVRVQTAPLASGRVFTGYVPRRLLTSTRPTAAARQRGLRVELESRLEELRFYVAPFRELRSRLVEAKQLPALWRDEQVRLNQEQLARFTDGGVGEVDLPRGPAALSELLADCRDVLALLNALHEPKVGSLTQAVKEVCTGLRRSLVDPELLGSGC